MSNDATTVDHELWPHQREAIDACTKQLLNAGRATVVAACGTGKTRTGAEVAQRLAAQRLLVVVPTLELLAQTVHAYQLAHSGAAWGRLIAVCSDQTITRRHEIDLRADHAEVTTDPVELQKLTAGPGRCTVLTTYASLPTVVAEAHRDHDLPPWDLVIIDEAHRSAGDHGRAWAAIHDDTRVPARRRLYLTATPRIITGGAGPDLRIASMDDPETFGPIVHELPFAEAIGLGLLADYRVVISVVAEPEARELIRRQPYLRVGSRQVDTATVAAQLALFRATDQYTLRKVITFHNRVARGGHFAATLPYTARALGRDPDHVWATNLSAADPPARRRDVLARLRDDDEHLAVVSNARILSEGIDAPAVDGILFADPRGSTIDTVQAIGRALRRGPRPDKTATIILPVLVAPGQEPDLLDRRSPYAGVWEVLRALRAHDQRAAVDLDDLRHRVGGGATDAPAVLPGWLHADGLPLPEQFIAAITVTAVDIEGTFEAQWRRCLAAARAYREEHGDLLVPQRWVSPDGLPLGSWINTQRVTRGRGRLPEYRIAELDALGMIWAVRDEQWAAGFAAAQQFVTQHGHLHPTDTHVTADGFRLGLWLANLRRRAATLPPERREAICQLDPEWNPPWPRDWQRGLIHARRFRDQHGHLDVAQSYRAPDGHALGSWIHDQRKRAEQLSSRQREALDALGMQWRRPAVRDQQWQAGLTAAQDFRKAHGHLQVPKGYVTGDGFKLGTWINNARRRHRAGKIPAHRWSALEKLGVQADSPATPPTDVSAPRRDLTPTFRSP